MAENKRVAIVGAGPSGLFAIKSALDRGLQPVAFQRNQGIGGVWNLQTGAVWRQMKTNISKYTCSLSDFPWPQKIPVHPSSENMFQYYQDYAQTFGLQKYIKFRSTISKIQRVSENGKKVYKISYEKDSKLETELFENVILASGIFNTPYLPKIEGIQNFKGRAFHSKFYREGKELSGMNVLIIGGSFTGVQLSANISKYASKVFHSFSNQFWIIPHFVEQNGGKVPFDFTFNREFYLEKFDPDTFFQTKNQWFWNLCKNQDKIPELKIKAQSYSKPIYVTVSTDYVGQCEAGKIRPIRSRVEKIVENNVYLQVGDKNPSQQIIPNIDCIILCTGYTAGLSYLSEQIQKIIQYDESDRLQPIVLYKQMYHPELQNMFFAGIYKPPFSAIIQHQIKAAVKYIAGQIKMPDKDELLKGLEQERIIRKMPFRMQQAHPDYINFCDQIAKISGSQLNIERIIKKIREFQLGNDQIREQAQLYKQFLKISVFPCTSHAFTTENIKKQIQQSKRIVEKQSIPL